MTNLLTLWREHRGWYSRRFAVHPACCECDEFYPEMVWTPAIRDYCDSSYTTRCCHSGTYDWKFVVGTRKGKAKLTVQSPVTALKRRGVKQKWSGSGSRSLPGRNHESF